MQTKAEILFEILITLQKVKKFCVNQKTINLRFQVPICFNLFQLPCLVLSGAFHKSPKKVIFRITSAIAELAIRKYVKSKLPNKHTVPVQ